MYSVERIVKLFNDARVDRVVHTGDITQAKTIDLLSNLHAPVFGVYGNNDQGELDSLETSVRKHGFHFIQPPLILEWAGRRIIVVHDPLELQSVDHDGCDVVLHGHTHLQTIHFEDARLTFNPGECAGMIEGSNAIGIVDLIQMDTRILKF